MVEYNIFAQKENKKIENPDEQYKVAAKAEQNLFRRIDYTNNIESRKSEEKIPFKKRPFKGVVQKKEAGLSSLDEPHQSKRKKGFPTVNPEETALKPGDVRAYDLFAPLPEMALINKSQFDDLELE